MANPRDKHVPHKCGSRNTGIPLRLGGGKQVSEPKNRTWVGWLDLHDQINCFRLGLFLPVMVRLRSGRSGSPGPAPTHRRNISLSGESRDRQPQHRQEERLETCSILIGTGKERRVSPNQGRKREERDLAVLLLARSNTNRFSRVSESGAESSDRLSSRPWLVVSALPRLWVFWPAEWPCEPCVR